MLKFIKTLFILGIVSAMLFGLFVWSQQVQLSGDKEEIEKYIEEMLVPLETAAPDREMELKELIEVFKELKENKKIGSRLGKVFILVCRHLLEVNQARQKNQKKLKAIDKMEIKTMQGSQRHVMSSRKASQMSRTEQNREYKKGRENAELEQKQKDKVEARREFMKQRIYKQWEYYVAKKEKIRRHLMKIIEKTENESSENNQY